MEAEIERVDLEKTRLQQNQHAFITSQRSSSYLVNSSKTRLVTKFVLHSRSLEVGVEIETTNSWDHEWLSTLTVNEKDQQTCCIEY